MTTAERTMERVGVTRRERRTVETMDALLSGGYVEHQYEGHLWRCDGCGLVWEKRGFAEGCAARGHVAHWMAGPYGVTYVLNGVPQGNIRYYPRDAVRREPVE